MLKVLIAEDDPMAAAGTKDILVQDGYEVCGIGRTVAEAVALGVAHRPDLAIIDLRLAEGGLGIHIAGQLGPLGRLGVLYATSSSLQLALTFAHGDACLSKPFCASELLRGLQIVAGIVATGRASFPFPRGFRVLRPAIAAPRLSNAGQHGSIFLARPNASSLSSTSGSA